MSKSNGNYQHPKGCILLTRENKQIYNTEPRLPTATGVCTVWIYRLFFTFETWVFKLALFLFVSRWFRWAFISRIFFVCPARHKWSVFIIWRDNGHFITKYCMSPFCLWRWSALTIPNGHWHIGTSLHIRSIFTFNDGCRTFEVREGWAKCKHQC